MEVTVRDATAPDAGALSRVLSAAFRDGRVARWLDPDPVGRRRLSETYFGAMVTSALTTGLVRVAELDGEIAGAALWFAVPGGEPAAGVPEDGVDPGVLERLGELEELVGGRHPGGPEHDYLVFLGVRPDRQGRGIGGTLLTDREGAGRPAYLEADDPRNRALYLRHGYADLGDPVTVEGEPLMWPMWREAS
jgi:GNAT superfamily N-acetyltransferase